MSVCFTICFDGQFWVGVLERLDERGVRAVKVTFGAEPTDAELREWVLENGNDLFARLDAAQPVAADSGTRPRTRNPKRVQREAARAARRPRASTAAQLALTADQESRGRAATCEAKGRRREEAARVRAKRRARAKAKHRGR